MNLYADSVPWLTLWLCSEGQQQLSDNESNFLLPLAESHHWATPLHRGLWRLHASASAQRQYPHTKSNNHTAVQHLFFNSINVISLHLVMQLAEWELKSSQIESQEQPKGDVGKCNVQACTAPGNHSVLNSVRNKSTRSCAWMVLNTVHLVTTYLHLRPHWSAHYPRNIANFSVPPCHCTFCSLPPGMPFSSFVPGKRQFMLFINPQVIHSPGGLLLLPPCSYAH